MMPCDTEHPLESAPVPEVRGLAHVAQKWEPVLRVSDMGHQKMRADRVNAHERDTL